MEGVPSLLTPPFATVIGTGATGDHHILVRYIAICVVLVGAIPRHLIIRISEHRPTGGIVNGRFVEVHFDIHIQPFGDIGFQRSVSGDFLHSGALQCTLLTEIVERSIVAYVLRSTADSHVVVLYDAGVEELVLPVIILLEQALGISSVCNNFGEEGALEFIELLRIHHFVVTVQCLLATDSSFEIHFHFVAFLTGLGSNDDDTTGCGSTVDTGRTCVLEDGNGLYVVGIEGTSHHSVNHVNGIGTCGDRTCTTDTDLRCVTRLSTGVGYSQTGYFTLEHVSDIGRRDIGKRLAVDCNDSGTQLCTFDSRITERNDLCQLGSIGFHNNLHVFDGTQFDCFVADIGQLKRCLVGHRKSKITINVGHGTSLCTFHQDTDADHGFLTICINHLTFDVNISKSRYREQKAEKDSYISHGC